MKTRDLLICAALGGITALAVIGFSGPLAALAAASPPLYALIGGYAVVLPLLALRLTMKAGAATITALCCAVIAWPFSALGLLLLIALVTPAVAFDLVYLARRIIGTESALWAGACVGALVIFLLSVPILSPEHLTPTVVLLTLIGRLLSYALACAVSAVIARALVRAGVRRSA